MHEFLRIEAQKTKGSLDLKYKKLYFWFTDTYFFICSTKPKKNVLRSRDPFLANNTA